MRYKFLNLNPLGLREQDCVCRAISLGLNIDYNTIYKKLCLVGKLFDCEKLCVGCYKYLLDEVYSLDRYGNYKGCRIEDFLENHTIGTYIIRVNGHLTCAIDGVLCDTWDCRDEIIDIVWIVE